MPIDYVTTFVDGSDPEWRKLYIRAIGRIPEIQRYRNYDTLRYALRGIEKYMPWINNVILIVQSKSQIPKWLDINNPKLRIVFHEDFIPKEFLPTFNSNVIEMFIHKIPRLSEKFILANDDMIPVKAMQESYFFVNDKPVDKLVIDENNISKPSSNGIFDYILFNTAKLAAKASNSRKVIIYKNWHLLIPHLKEIWNFLWNKYANEIKVGLLNSKKRQRRNHNHWLFRYFALNTGNFTDNPDLNTSGYLLLKDTTSKEEISSKIANSDVVCFNDGIKQNLKVIKYAAESLNSVLPEKSNFELEAFVEKSCTKYTPTEKRNILCIDRATEENNGFGLFRYLLENYSDKINVRYLTDLNSILRKYPNDAFSFARDKNRICAWADTICFSYNIPFVSAIQKTDKTKIFLQHGITWAKSDKYIASVIKNSTFATCTTRDELEYFNSLGTDCKNFLTGMAIYDTDVLESTKEKIIVIMFTYRSNQKMPWIESFLNSSELKYIKEKLGYKLYFFKHHASKVSNKIPSFICRAPLSELGTMIKKCSVCITDFSSIAFKAAYLDKSVYCFQPDIETYSSNDTIKSKGWFDWKTQCPGYRSENKEELLKHLVSELDGNTSASATNKSIFEYTDTNNCKRICEDVLNIK